jgi:hypothetical protein
MEPFLIVLTILFAAFGWFSATRGEKTQTVRLFDILLYGPYLIFLAFQPASYILSIVEKIFILFLGSTTVTYNLRNYLHQ